MVAWEGILQEIAEERSASAFDRVRRRHLRQLADITGRNVIAYYSGWLQRPHILRFDPEAFSVNDNDQNGFMTTIHGLDRSKGLDLLLHTPGGGVAATESLVGYLRSMFDTDIRAIVPQLAQSAGTMIACSCKSIVMGKQSNLGPIDPQFRGIPAHGVIEEFERAFTEIQQDNAKIPIWQPIIAQYPPTFIGDCEKAIEWSNQIVGAWLVSGMFLGDPDATAKSVRIVDELSDHALTKAHDRHISSKRATEIGLEIENLEDNQQLQDAVLSVHHAFTHTLASTSAVKVIENHEGNAFIQNVTIDAVQGR